MKKAKFLKINKMKMNFNYHEVLVKTRNALNFQKGNMH